MINLQYFGRTVQNGGNIEVVAILGWSEGGVPLYSHLGMVKCFNCKFITLTFSFLSIFPVTDTNLTVTGWWCVLKGTSHWKHIPAIVQEKKTEQ